MPTVEDFRSKLRQRIGNGITNLGIKQIASTVILTGIAKCYYHKQVVNVVALEMFPKCRISNHIEVLYLEPKLER